jgi:hypothetical protein
MKLPPVKDLYKLFVALKRTIGDEYRADEFAEQPSMMVTIGWSSETGEWSYQTGDNSYTGSAYHHPHWAVIYLDRKSNSHDMAIDARNQLSELAAF